MREYNVKLDHMVREFDLEPLRKAANYDGYLLRTEDVNRPGLQLIGFFDYFDPNRIQILGKVEYTYLTDLSQEDRRRSFELLMAQDIPALIITRGMEPFPECMEMAEKYDRTVLRTQETTTAFMGALIVYLRAMFSPQITRHGVLVEIYGEGVFITGESGVGKSETAIEIIKRGHRLIADDAVEIRQVNNHQLVGTAPELIRHYMELRGIGVVDIRRLYGVGAVKAETNIDLIINLELWQEGKIYDRLGLEEHTTEILGVELPTVTIPVRPGRNMAVILEVAAMNNRYKKMGYNAAKAFSEQIDRNVDEIQAAQERAKQ